MNQSQINEVARLRDLLNRVMQMTAVTWGDWIHDIEKIKKEARLAPAPEETEDGATMDEWYNGFSKIKSTEDQKSMRYRTRRPLPVQEEMPLEKQISYLEINASRSADLHNHVLIVDCIRYLRDEIEQLKKNQSLTQTI
jgi:hypothetical protein